MGEYSQATGEESTAVGGTSFFGLISAEASGTNSSAFGAGAGATGEYSTAVGSLSWADGDDSSAFGYGAYAAGSNSVAIGALSEADRDNSISVGTVGGERRHQQDRDHHERQAVTRHTEVMHRDAVRVIQLRGTLGLA